MSSPSPPADPRPAGAWQLGSVAGAPLYVQRSWLLVAALIAVVFAPRVETVAPGLGNLVYVAGLGIAVLLYLSVLLHEVSHALMARAYGMRVISVTLHFLGGVTHIEDEAETPGREFWIAVVGPLSSAAIGLAALAAARVVPDGLLLFAVQSLAIANLVLAVINSLPGLPLDGGAMLRALVWSVSGRPALATIVAAWGGRVVAVTILGYPLLMAELFGSDPTLLDFVLAGVVASFVWSGATQSLVVARLRARLPALHARAMARRALAVPEDLPLSEAVRRAREVGAGSLVTVETGGRPIGIVNEHAVDATPDDRRPWVSAGALARRIDVGLALSADLVGEPLVRAMNAAPSSEYLLLETDGSVFGVLVTADVDAALTRTAPSS
ncbi:MAG: site-2 protease family protein [Actinomycetota bacterium]|nr:site-2 protease family protein [Actinomycetota bacterium]